MESTKGESSKIQKVPVSSETHALRVREIREHQRDQLNAYAESGQWAEIAKHTELNAFGWKLEGSDEYLIPYAVRKIGEEAKRLIPLDVVKVGTDGEPDALIGEIHGYADAREQISKGEKVDKEARNEAKLGLDAIEKGSPAAESTAHFAKGGDLGKQAQEYFASAKDLLESVLRLNPQSSQAKVSLAEIEFLMGHNETATEKIGALLKDDPGCAEALELFIRVFGKVGDAAGESEAKKALFRLHKNETDHFVVSGV